MQKIDELIDSYTFVPLPERNLVISFGPEISVYIPCKRTLGNRFKYWMLCKFFPFTIEEWEKGGKMKPGEHKRNVEEIWEKHVKDKTSKASAKRRKK